MIAYLDSGTVSSATDYSIYSDYSTGTDYEYYYYEEPVHKDPSPKPKSKKPSIAEPSWLEEPLYLQSQHSRPVQVQPRMMFSKSGYLPKRIRKKRKDK